MTTDRLSSQGVSIFLAALTLITCVGIAALVSWHEFSMLYTDRQTLGSTSVNIRLLGALIVTAALLVGLLVTADKSTGLLQGLIDVPFLHPIITITVILAAAAIAVIFCIVSLRAFPNSGDEYDYVFQAETYLAGHLWNPLSPLHEWFSHSHIFEKDGKWVAQYPPGWPSIIALTELVGMPPYLASPICALLLALAFMRLCHDLAEAQGMFIGVALLVLSSFFALNAASYFSHIATAIFGVMFISYGLRYLDDAKLSAALSCGASLGTVGFIRPISALLFAAPFVVELALRAKKVHFIRSLWIITGATPFLAVSLLYNYMITGNPFLVVTSWGYPLLKLGFHPSDEVGNVVNIVDTSVMMVKHFVRLVEWTSPLLLALYGVCLFRKSTTGSLRSYDFIFPMFVLFYLFYPSTGGNQYGPRYYFEALPFFILTIASVLPQYLAMKTSCWKPRIVRSAFAAHLVFAYTAIPVLAFEMRRIVDERMELFDLVKAHKLSHAIVVIRSATGTLAAMEPKDLTHNGISLTGDVLYAIDFNHDYSKLRARYPDRCLYFFERPGAIMQETGPGRIEIISGDPPSCE
jgi:hypothetical protein